MDIKAFKSEIIEFINKDSLIEIFGEISLEFNCSWYRIVKYNNNTELYIKANIDNVVYEKQKETEKNLTEFIKWIEKNS